MNSKIKNILIFVSIGLILVLIYFFFIKKDKVEENLVSSVQETNKEVSNTNVDRATSLIDEEYSEINIGKGACVELYFSFGNWYIVSSDGMKMEELH
jgi:hypothetical protein